MHIQGLVRTERGIDLSRDPGGGDAFVLGQRIGRVIGCSDHGDLVGGKNPVCGQIIGLKACIGLFPDHGGVLLVDEKVDSKDTEEFKMAPMIERIADCIREGFCEG